MALDGAFLHQLAHEIETVALDSRIDRIMQPTRDELVLLLRWRGGSGRLLLSASAGKPRIHFTEHTAENPQNPPMFCMLLRKHLSGGRLIALCQPGLDRVLRLKFECRSELGDLVTISVIIEIMGKHSNIIVVDQNERVIDSIKRVGLETSSLRQVLPGIRYELPPAQNKLNFMQEDFPALRARLLSGRDVPLAKALLEALQGCSPILCREIAHHALAGGERTVSELDEGHWQRLASYMEQLAQTLRAHTGTPTLVQALNGRPQDFSFLPIQQYGDAMRTQELAGYSKLLDNFYAKRDLIERMRQKSSDLLRMLSNLDQRIARKLAAQQLELVECQNREQLRIQGDLVTANLYQIQAGSSGVRLANYYEPDSPTVEVLLDSRLSPSQNAQRYYSLYRKAATAEKKLLELIATGEQDRTYIDSVLDALTRATTEAELQAIRQELTETGYLRPTAQQKGKRPPKADKLAPLQFLSSDGYTIFVGRNNLQNDRLTLKQSRGNDLWLHTQKIPGSHVIIAAQGNAEIPPRTIEQAAVLAATHSKARDSGKVPVDYVQIRHVKKPSGAKAGMVIYENYQTLLVAADEQLAEQLQVK